ncbi:uncharacterized protein A4U43_C01F8100 [Asparagus officinalis]|uniref:Uncharacterized protein n=1 Tax=Asparagus officinalis TaxID=4686 RepID=A0A5P1FN02_ASPOF|nr:uncharacterized protein A4U43_C01F8100 [Asparagus officinalis]
MSLFHIADGEDIKFLTEGFEGILKKMRRFTAENLWQLVLFWRYLCQVTKETNNECISRGISSSCVNDIMAYENIVVRLFKLYYANTRTLDIISFLKMIYHCDLV